MVWLVVIVLYVMLFLTGHWMQGRGQKGWRWMTQMMIAYPVAFALGLLHPLLWGIATIVLLGYTVVAFVKELKRRDQLVRTGR